MYLLKTLPDFLISPSPSVARTNDPTWEVAFGASSHPHIVVDLRVGGHAQEAVDDVRLAVELVVDHDGEDSHLGGAAVVELNAPLL